MVIESGVMIGSNIAVIVVPPPDRAVRHGDQRLLDHGSGSVWWPCEGLASSTSGHPSWIGAGGVTRGSTRGSRLLCGESGHPPTMLRMSARRRCLR
jgi:hypothetical protein